MHGYRHDMQGFALFMVVIFLLVISLIAIDVLQTSIWQQRISLIQKTHYLAQLGAESVINRVYYEIENTELNDEHLLVGLFDQQSHHHCITSQGNLIQANCLGTLFDVDKLVNAHSDSQLILTEEPLVVDNELDQLWVYFQILGVGRVGSDMHQLAKQTIAQQYIVNLPIEVVEKLTNQQSFGQEYADHQMRVKPLSWQIEY